MIELLEGMMLACFSVSWWFSIARMIDTKSPSEKSAGFVVLICIGYLLGAASKLIVWRESGEISPVLWIFTLNFCVICCDAALSRHYRRLSRSGRITVGVAG